MTFYQKMAHRSTSAHQEAQLPSTSNDVLVIDDGPRVRNHLPHPNTRTLQNSNSRTIVTAIIELVAAAPRQIFQNLLYVIYVVGKSISNLHLQWLIWREAS